MKNRGFTLIELLGVVVILGVLALIAIPTVDSIVGRNRRNLYKAQVQSIKDSLKTWGDANAASLPDAGETLTINLGVLKLAGFMSNDVENPLVEGTCFSNELPLIISNNKGTYTYEVDVDAMNKLDSGCNGAPKARTSIILTGADSVSVNVGGTFQDPGYVIVDKNGSIINDTANVVVLSYNGSETTIKTNSPGTYTIKYTYEGVVVFRIVTVVRP